MNTKKQIKKLLALGLTQDIVASETKTTQPTISRILNGLHVDVKASTALAVDALYRKTIESAQTASPTP